MSILPQFEFKTQRIRQDNNRISILDTIRVIGGRKNPTEVWNRIIEEFPEVIDFSTTYKFAGKGQRNTPVTDREGILQIIGLLPGTVGKKYRKEAAKLFLQFLDVPEEVAKQAILKLQDSEKVSEVEEAAKRQNKYLKSFHGFMDVLYQFGCTRIHFGTVNRANNDLVDISGSRTNNMTERQRTELDILQAMQRIRLEDELAHIHNHNRPDWEAVDTSIVQGAKTLAHIRGCSEQDAMNKVKLSSSVEKWKRPQLNQRIN